MGGISRRAALGVFGTGVGAAACSGPLNSGPTDETIDVRFEHGVASGDPLHERVIIWTRATPVIEDRPFRLVWEMSERADFQGGVRRGEVETSLARDYTVKVDVDGLKPGKTYYYRFRVGSAISPVGRTKTAPRKGDRFAFGIASCSHYGFGYFNAYEALAQREDVDVVLHLGDYIYEYGPDGYGGKESGELGRTPQPPREILTLDDYRLRHAQYKSDPDLQAVHAAHPFIAMWDDHESANDSHTNGAQNHHPSEGLWSDRKEAAIRAYYEWMPVREPGEELTAALHRSFSWGDAADLFMLETRLTGRDAPLDYERDFEFVGPMPNIVKMTALINEDRNMIPPAQEAWLAAGLKKSVGRGASWQVIGNQTIMARFKMPNVAGEVDEAGKAVLASRYNGADQLVMFSTLNMPANLDAWDGYPRQRDRVYQMIEDAGASTVVVTGDSHAFWANELFKTPAAEQRIGVEFGTSSITSPSFGALFQGLVKDFGARQAAVNREVLYNNQDDHGFVVVTLTPTEAVAEFVRVSSIRTKRYEAETILTVTTPRVDGGVGEPVLSVAQQQTETVEG